MATVVSGTGEAKGDGGARHGGGQSREAREGSRDTLKSHAPATGALLGEVPIASADDVKRAVARARRAQEAWALLPVAERCERILRLRNAFIDRADEIVDLLTRECGKPRQEALSCEVIPVADLIGFYAARAERILAARPIDLHLMKYRRSYVHYTPRGV
jgi:acyl-CoA reductase-like NAD-dependent aldehyde dehydrogenase